jgi:hypothetical protein
MTTLLPITDDLWIAEGDLFIGPLAWFPVRMTVVRLGDAVWVCNPIALDDELIAAIAAIGPVRWVVEPNGFHSAWAAEAMERWPDAELLCSSAHGRLGTKLPPWQPLEQTPGGWKDLEPLLIEGVPKVAETVFLHRPSRTLITTDLFFNLHTTKRWLMPWIWRLAGAWGRPAQSRLWRLFVTDRAAAGASVRRMLAWDFERVLIAHGDNLEGPEARAQVEAALAWMLAAPVLPAAA